MVISSNLEVVAEFAKKQGIVDVASQRVGEQIYIECLQGLRCISHTHAIDKVKHDLFLDLKFTLQYRPEEV